MEKDNLESQLRASIAQLRASIAQAKTTAQAQRKEHKIQLKCEYCGKTVLVESETQWSATKVLRKYTCGHSSFETFVDVTAIERDNIWERLYPFQRTGIQFVEQSNFKCLIADEMGLGKTIQSLVTVRYNWDALTPLLIICQAGDIYRWQKEINEWINDKYTGFINHPIIHKGGSLPLAPGFKIQIISMALLSSEIIQKSIRQYGFQCLIADESHSFKNEHSQRTTGLMDIAKIIPHKIFLSGTPVLNRITEYFTTLNILRPEHFPSKYSLTSKCAVDQRGRYLNLLPEWREPFFEKTKKYIIRRTKAEVGIQLPTFQHFFDIIDVLGNNGFTKEDNEIMKDMGISPIKGLVKNYNKLLDELELIVSAKHRNAETMGNIMGLMAELRHITGLLKIKEILRYTLEYLESTEERKGKISIGVHHKLVMDFIKSALEQEGYKVITISNENAAIKDAKEAQFRDDPDTRIGVLSILGAGQGRNLQFCTKFIVGERQWNPAKESQFEGRFHRIKKNTDGSVKTEFDDTERVEGTYLIAKDTIDEFFDELVKLKFQVTESTMDHEFSIDQDFIFGLAERVITKRLRYVGA